MILISSRSSFRGFQDELVLTLYFSFWGIFIELTSQLEKERSEINRLENEKKDWLSRGVHAEFEKKDKVHNNIFIIINIHLKTTCNLFSIPAGPNPLTPILLCLTSDNFTCQWGTPW